MVAVNEYFVILRGQSIRKCPIRIYSRQVKMASMIYTLFYVFYASFFHRYGRRTAFFTLLFMEVTISIITSFSTNYTVFTVLRTLNGVTFPALFQIPFILCKYT